MKKRTITCLVSGALILFLAVFCIPVNAINSILLTPDYHWAENIWGAAYSGSVSNYKSDDQQLVLWQSYAAGLYLTWPAVRTTTDSDHEYDMITVYWDLCGNKLPWSFSPGVYTFKIWIRDLVDNEWDVVQDWKQMNNTVAIDNKDLTGNVSRYIQEWGDDEFRVFISVTVNSAYGQCPYVWIDQLNVELYWS